MPILALVMLFISASMHALWNFLLKSAEEKYVAMGWQTILSGILALVVVVFYAGLPPRDMWLFAIISMLLEAAAEAEAQRFGGLGFVVQRGVVET